tara:strand:- start:1014 stop:1316 length:303 start_codon:yes stop_codon:yes gene_type:complete
VKNVPIEEMEEPKGYNVSLCFEWMNWDSCLTFEIVTDGVIANKVDMVKDLIEAWGGVVEMEDDGTVVNLKQFKTAYVTESKKGWGDIDPLKKPTNLRVVH